MNTIEIWCCKAVIYFLQKGYGPKCQTQDLDDHPHLKYNTPGRCPTCHANEIIDWLKSHINLIDE